jgi:acylglycerol lipase
VSSADKTLRVYPGGRHEPHNDLEKDELVTDVSEWISARVHRGTKSDARLRAR